MPLWQSVTHITPLSFFTPCLLIDYEASTGSSG
jgi:hypothetical protein